MKLSKQQLGYLAGIMDGEGTITFSYHKNRMSMPSAVTYVCVVANSNPLIIKGVTSLLGLIPVKYAVYTQRHKRSVKESYLVQIRGMESAKLYIKMIRPYLIGKKQQADLLMEYLKRRKPHIKVKSMTERDWQIIETVRHMNRNYGTSFPAETTRESLPIEGDDIVRPSQRCEESTRNEWTESEIS
jgi:hypothetical protein